MKRVLALLVLGTALSTCRGGSGAEVLVKGFRFQPKRITVPSGTSVTWSQRDDTLHAITSGTPGDPSGLFDRRDFGMDQRFSFEFTRAGTVRYFCSNHPEGMRGTVIVE